MCSFVVKFLNTSRDVLKICVSENVCTRALDNLRMVSGQLPPGKLFPPVRVRVWFRVRVRIRVRGQFSSGVIALEPLRMYIFVLKLVQLLSFSYFPCSTKIFKTRPNQVLVKGKLFASIKESLFIKVQIL